MRRLFLITLLFLAPSGCSFNKDLCLHHINSLQAYHWHQVPALKDFNKIIFHRDLKKLEGHCIKEARKKGFYDAGNKRINLMRIHPSSFPDDYKKNLTLLNQYFRGKSFMDIKNKFNAAGLSCSLEDEFGSCSYVYSLESSQHCYGCLTGYYRKRYYDFKIFFEVENGLIQGVSKTTDKKARVNYE